MLRSRRYSRQTGEEDHGFRLEDGTETSITTDRAAFMSNIILENPETETRWYFRYFLTKFHQNFVAFLPGSGQTDMEPVMLSVLNDDSGSIRAILWRKTGSERLLTKGARGKSVDPKKVIQGFGHGTPDRRIQEVKDPAIQQDLLRVEEQEGAVNFKIGVLFAAAGQTTDDEMFSNNNAPPDFEQFYKCLGEYKALKGHQGYRGGLDVNNDTTGTHSVHTIEFGKEIMYHIATLLPFSKVSTAFFFPPLTPNIPPKKKTQQKTPLYFLFVLFGVSNLWIADIRLRLHFRVLFPPPPSSLLPSSSWHRHVQSGQYAAA